MESLTLMAGTFRLPSAHISIRRWTPVGGFFRHAMDLIQHVGILFVDVAGEVARRHPEFMLASPQLTIGGGTAGLLQAPPVLFFGFALPGKHGGTPPPQSPPPHGLE